MKFQERDIQTKNDLNKLKKRYSLLFFVGFLLLGTFFFCERSLAVICHSGSPGVIYPPQPPDPIVPDPGGLGCRRSSGGDGGFYNTYCRKVEINSLENYSHLYKSGDSIRFEFDIECKDVLAGGRVPDSCTASFGLGYATNDPMSHYFHKESFFSSSEPRYPVTYVGDGYYRCTNKYSTAQKTFTIPTDIIPYGPDNYECYYYSADYCAWNVIPDKDIYALVFPHWGSSDNTGYGPFGKKVNVEFGLDPTITSSLSVCPKNPVVGELTATRTGGEATGNITYQFDCDNNGTIEGTYTTANASQKHNCSYSEYICGNYKTAKVTLTQQGVSSSSTVQMKLDPFCQCN